MNHETSGRFGHTLAHTADTVHQPGSPSSAVTTYTLTPEQLAAEEARLANKLRSPERKPPGLEKQRTLREKGFGSMASKSITREKYLTMRSQGLSKELIVRDLGMTLKALKYHLTKWSLLDGADEQRAIRELIGVDMPVAALKRDTAIVVEDHRETVADEVTTPPHAPTEAEMIEMLQEETAASPSAGQAYVTIRVPITEPSAQTMSAAETRRYVAESAKRLRMCAAAIHHNLSEWTGSSSPEAVQAWIDTAMGGDAR